MSEQKNAILEDCVAQRESCVTILTAWLHLLLGSCQPCQNGFEFFLKEHFYIRAKGFPFHISYITFIVRKLQQNMYRKVASREY